MMVVELDRGQRAVSSGRQGCLAAGVCGCGSESPATIHKVLTWHLARDRACASVVSIE